MEQIIQSSGNSKPIIDYRKVIDSQKAVWTLETLGIQLEDIGNQCGHTRTAELKKEK